MWGGVELAELVWARLGWAVLACALFGLPQLGYAHLSSATFDYVQPFLAVLGLAMINWTWLR